ncbi:MAG: hypothetical protein HQ580_15120 [Planctomycetes bacterium]|nr:hypothetical protein [Planctomycetota bacterium]
MDNAEQYLVYIDGAAALLGISRATFNRWQDKGKLGPLPVHLSSRPQWCVQELKEWAYCHCPTRTQWQIIRQKKIKAMAE